MGGKQEISSLTQQGRVAEARSAAMALCRKDPGDIEAWMLLGSIHMNAGDLPEAAKCYTRIADLQPNHTGALYNLGVISQQLGKFPEAARYYQEALQIQPDFVPAAQNLGHILKEVGSLEPALACFSKIIELQPDWAPGYYNRALVAQTMGHYEAAESDFRQAIAFDPSVSEYCIFLGKLLDIQGRFEEALELFEQALAIQPDSGQAVAAKAISLERQKKYEAAYTLLKPFVDRGSADGEIARAFATVGPYVGQMEAAIEHLRRVLATPELSPTARYVLGFSLGQLYDRTGQYDRAFSSIRQANALSPGRFDYNQLVDFVDALIDTYTPERMSRFPGGRDQSNLPVFIVGMPRSGTSLVEQILAAHPQVFGAGELPDIGDFTQNLSVSLGVQSRYPVCMQNLTQEVTDSLARRYLDRLAALSGGADRVTNKMPHNFQSLGFIEVLFPGARVIHISRSPMDTCLSLHFHSFNAVHAYTTDLTHLGEYYRQYVRIMAHWRRVHGIALLEIDYEELVAEPEAVTRRLLEFCALPWDSRCLEFHESDRFVGTPSYDQVRRPVYSSSVGRWAHYEKYLAPLIDALGDCK